MRIPAVEFDTSRVERHAFGTEALASLAADTRAKFESQLRSGSAIKPRKLLGLARLAEEVLTDGSVLARNDPFLWGAMAVLAQANTALVVARATAAGQPLTLELGPRRLHLKAFGAESPATWQTWFVAW